VEVAVSGTVDRPVGVVFEFMVMDHVHNHPRWDPEMDLEQITDGPMGLGTIIRRHSRHFDPPVDGTMEVIGFEENRSVTMQIQDGESPAIESVVTFEQVDFNQTRFTLAVDLPWLDESADTSQISGPMERSARNIKALIESET
jgi:hypothetical protein